MNIGEVLKQQEHRGFQIVVVRRRDDIAVSFGKGDAPASPLLGWFDDAGEALAAGVSLIDLTVEQEMRLSPSSQRA
jgi:hypothetical protein